MSSDDCIELGIKVDKLEGEVGVKVISMEKSHGALFVGDVILLLNGRRLPDADAAHEVLSQTQGNITFVISNDTEELRERTRSAAERLRGKVLLRVVLFAARARQARAQGKPKMGDRMSDFI